MKHDEIDTRILEILDQDGRTKFTDITKSIQRTEGTIRNRVKRLQEDFVLQSRAKKELVCPWCHIHCISAIVNHRMLHLKCSECGMGAFISRIHRNKKPSDYISRRMIL